MPTTRTLMFLVNSGSTKADAPKISGVELDSTLGAAFRLAMIARGLHHQQTPLDYSFYDWEVHPIPEEMKVREIPPPGIIVAVKKGLSDRLEVLAGQLKYHLTWFEKGTLDSFLQDPSTQFVPSKLGNEVMEAVEAKPGLFGVTVDVKRVSRALFKRWGRKS